MRRYQGESDYERIRAFLQQTADIVCWHMALDHIAVNKRGVATGQCGCDASLLLER